MSKNERFGWKRTEEIQLTTPEQAAAMSTAIIAAEKRKAGRPKGTARGKHRFMTEEEMVRFMKAAKKAGPEEWLMLGMTYFYGLRVSQLVALRWADIDLKARLIMVPALKHGRGRPYELTAPLLKALTAAERRKSVWAAEWLFPSRHAMSAAHVTTQTAKNIFKRVARAAGVTGKSIHSLRHTCAMERAMAGDNMITLASWLQHSRLESVQEYITAARNAKHEAVLAPIVGRFLL
jgi:type 1 fimbriae regulatory protein FimE